MDLWKRGFALAAVMALLPGCSPKWPAERFPAGLEVKRTLFAAGGGGLRETCEAMVVEITDRAASMFRLRTSKDSVTAEPPADWKKTPIVAGEKHTFYKGAFGGCNNGGDGPLGDLPGWLNRPGAFYRVFNGGEGVAIIVPRSKLAGFYYFG